MSSIIPKYLICDFSSKGISFIYNLTEVFTFFGGGWNKIKFDLPILRDNLLVFNQFLTYDNSEFIIDSRLKRFLWRKKKD